MKATMSSFRERRLSVVIVNYPFSQMRVGKRSEHVETSRHKVEKARSRLWVWEHLNPGGTPLASVRTPRFCLPEYTPRGCAASVVLPGWNQRSAYPAAAVDQGGGAGNDGADQQIRVP